VGIRFTGLNIPTGAVITRAYIQFQVDEASTGGVNVLIRGENTDNASTFSTAVNNISSRNRTGASAAWSPPAWSSIGAAGAEQRTSDLTAIVQEIVSRGGWQSGNAMAFIFSGSDSTKRVAESFDGDQAGAPLLHVEYATDATVIAPVITLLGDNPLYLNVGDTFTDPGATATDNIDGDLTSSIQSSSNVNTSVAGSYSVNYSVTDSDGNSATAVRSVVVSDGSVQTFTVERRVASSADDAEEQPDGSVSMSSSDLELVFDHALQFVGIRFSALDIPDNAIITKAYIQFQVDEASTGSDALDIYGESTDNAPAFNLTTGNISSRNRSVASAAWSPPAWSSVGAAGTEQRTADLTAIVQEIVSRAGWQSGNAMAFIISGIDTTKRVAEAYDGDAAGAPLLHVEYSMDITAVPPVITLLGENPLYLNAGETFIDPGATAEDIPDGDLTSLLQSSSNVNTAVPESYSVNYSVTDSDGNSAEAARSVVVLNSVGPLVRIGFIKRSSADAAILGDLEAFVYSGVDNTFTITDDVERLIYWLDLGTEQVTDIIPDSEFGAYAQANPGAFEPIGLICSLNAGVWTGFCDPEAVAHDPVSDDMYVFTGNHPGELSGFRLSRSAPGAQYEISGWKRTPIAYTAAIFIDNQFYVAILDAATNEGKIVTYDWDTDTVGSPILTISDEIEDIEYANGILWVLTAPEMLYRIRYSDKQILDSYDMRAYDINDPRGVAVVGNKLYIGDGYDLRTDDLLHAIHIFALP